MMSDFTENPNNLIPSNNANPAPIELTFQPTIFLYLGTTPGEVGYRLKKLLHRAYGDVPIIRHLWIDLDSKIIPQARPWFRSDERAELSGVDPAAVIKNIDYYPSIKEWWPTGSRLPAGKLTSDGANLQMRLVGRLALFRMYNERAHGLSVYDLLRTVTESIFEIENTSGTIAKSSNKVSYSVREGCRIVIIHSTGGGSGSALCFDVAYLCRHLLDGKHPKVTSIAILPSVIDKGMTNQDQSKIEKVRANTYAWFREENHLSETAHWRVKYPEGAIVDVTSPPFDYCYVVDIENQANHRLNSQDDVFDMIAQAVFLETGSSIGSEQDSLDAIAHVFSTAFNGMRRSFSSMAAASLIYPKERLLNYCANRFGSALLRDGLCGEPEEQQVKVDAATLRSNLRFDDSNLMSDLLSGVHIRMNREQAILKADTVGGALTQMDAQEIENRASREEARKTLDQFNNKHLLKLKAALDQEITRLAATRGFSFAQAVLYKLLEPASDGAVEADITSFEGLKKRLQQQGGSEDDLQHAVKEYQSARTALQKLDNGPEDVLERMVSPKGWAKKFKQAKAELVNKNKNISEITLQLAAQKNALDIYNQLGTFSGILNTRLVAVISAINSAASELDKVYKQLTSQEVSKRGIFEFTQEIGVDFAEYYKRHSEHANAGTAFAGIIPHTVTSDLATLTTWTTEKIKSAAVDYARRYFIDALEKTSLLSTLKEMAEKAGVQPQDLIEEHLDRLVKYCHPFWKYEANRGLSPSDGVSILGVEDENSSLIPARYRSNRMYQIKTTGFLDRIDLLRTSHGMPAFLLKGMNDYRVDYENLRKGLDPLHILKDMELAPDVLPEQGRRGRDMFARAKAFDYIVQLGTWFYFDLEKGYVNDGIKPRREYRLAQGRENSSEAFSHRDDWQAQAEEAINRDVENMGNIKAIAQLDEAIKTLKKQIADAKSGEESVRKQLEREVQALQAYQRELGKIG